MSDFHGTKVALIHDENILIYLRDNTPDIRYPGLWDLSGGGREGDETPTETAIREVYEEFGIVLEAEQLPYIKSYPSMHDKSVPSWFMAGNISAEQVGSIRLAQKDRCIK